MMPWLFDTTSNGGDGNRWRRFAARDVTELHRHLRFLALVIVLGLSVMSSVVAMAWFRFG